ncbi:MAG: S46 family peptidase [Elusimicrobiota bacterium]
MSEIAEDVHSSNPGFFVANLDTYGGNSGSAVFNVETNLVEGILLRSESRPAPDRKLG